MLSQADPVMLRLHQGLLLLSAPRALNIRRHLLRQLWLLRPRLQLDFHKDMDLSRTPKSALR
jgi:hypothetical protein